jgi:hypothetical protein
LGFGRLGVENVELLEREEMLLILVHLLRPILDPHLEKMVQLLNVLVDQPQHIGHVINRIVSLVHQVQVQIRLGLVHRPVFVLVRLEVIDVDNGVRDITQDSENENFFKSVS